MLSTVIFYTALLSTVLPINGLHDKQLEEVVRLLGNQIANDKSSSSEESNENDGARSFVDKLRTLDVINLIQQANKNKKSVQNYNDGQRFKVKSNILDQLYPNFRYDSDRNDRGSYGVNNRVLEKLLKAETKPSKNSFHQRLTPNRLLNFNQFKNFDEDKGFKGGSSDYSKLFVILDPIALQKSRNTENLSNLLSRILAQTSSAVDMSRQDRYAHQRYKSFVLKDNSRSRRFRHDSKEMYSGGKGDMDDDYRPKRLRNSEYSGGGGGGGGRTAIPYIRHRGDIYEKDH